MKKMNLKSYHSKNREALEARTAKVGGYSFFLTIIVLAIIIAVNAFVCSLPKTKTQFDISATQLYSLTSSTKVVVNNLEKDVNIYWIVQAGKEDSVIERILNVYDDMSDHITVTKKDPDTYPTFAKQYTDETITNNSIIVECGTKSRYIAYNSIYEIDSSNYANTGSVTYDFDGEGEITTAIDFVVSDDLPIIRVLSGHNEQSISDTFTKTLERQNIQVEKDFSLLNVDKIPEDTDAILINAPASDLSEEEVTILKDYIDDGGHVIVLSSLQKEEKLEHLNSVLEYYGVTVEDGVVIEGSRDNYAFREPYFLLANINSSEITDSLIEAGSYVIVPIAQGLTIGNTGNNTVTELLSTSDMAYSKIAGYSLTTYDKEEGDIDGPFSLAVSVETQKEGKMIWISSSGMLDDTYNQYSSGANADFVMNSLSWMIGETDAIAIRSKSLDYNYLTISESASRWIKIWMIGIIPFCFVIYGINEVILRKKQN